MAPPSGRELRREPRLTAVLRLRYRRAENLLVSYCTNLSRGGLFVPTDTPLPVGATLDLEIELPGTGQVRTIPATVRWVRSAASVEGPAGMGLAFRDVDQAIGRYVDGLMTRYKPPTVALVVPDSGAGEHLASAARNLVHCTVERHRPGAVAASEVASADVVIVDVEATGEGGLALLHELSQQPDPPPRIALVPAADPVAAERCKGLATTLEAPIDPKVLGRTMLEALAEAQVADLDPGDSFAG